MNRIAMPVDRSAAACSVVRIPVAIPLFAAALAACRPPAPTEIARVEATAPPHAAVGTPGHDDADDPHTPTHWPPNNAPCKDVSTSPDGAWIVCEGERGEQSLEPTPDPTRSSGRRTYMARRLEVRSTNGDTVHRLMDDWISDGAIAVPNPSVLGWLDRPTRLVFAESACGEGCGFGDCGSSDPRVLDVATGRVDDVDLPGWKLALDTAHHRLASTPGTGGAVLAMDLDSGQRWTILPDGQAGQVTVGSLAWTTDGQALLREEALGDACGRFLRVRTVRFDLASGTAEQVGDVVLDDRYATATPAPDEPDAWGYAPGDAYVDPTAKVADGPLLAQLQAMLDARDVRSLVALAATADGAPADVKLRAADGREALVMLARDDLANALYSILNASPPHHPAVQGAIHGNRPQAGAEDSSADTWVVLSGWQADIVLAGQRMADRPTVGGPVRSTSSMVWRFTPGPDGRGWRWLEWRLGEPTYSLTFEDLQQDLQAKKADLPRYTAVRRAEWWPTNDAPCKDVSTSPDGVWTACYGEATMLDFGGLRSLRLEIRSADGRTVYRPVQEWTAAGIGQTTYQILGWTAGSAGLMFSATGCGDGCGPWTCEEDVRLVRLTDGVVRNVDVEGHFPALSPDGARLATLAFGTPDGLVLHVRDIARHTDHVAALAGEDGGLAWSPDGGRIAVTWDVKLCTADVSAGAKIFDVATQTLSDLVPLESGYRFVQAWSDPDEIEFNVNRPTGDGRWVGVERRDSRTGALLGVATATSLP